MTDNPIPRRQFLVGAGVAGTAVAAALAPNLTPPAAAQTPAAAATTPAVEPFLTLTATEAAFITAAVDTLIPADELTPAGSDCGIAVFIDRQLASAWGGGAKSYRAGPFQKGKPEQGYQLALTPREYFAAGIAAANEWSRHTYGKEFDRLATDDRIAALTTMDEGKAEFREGGYEYHQSWVDLDLGAEGGSDSESPKGERERRTGHGASGGEAGSKEPEPPKTTASPQAKQSSAVKPQSPSTKPVTVDKDKQRAVKRFEKQVAEAEAKVADLEARLAGMQKEMASMDPSDWQAFSARLDAQKGLEADLAYAMSDWEAAQGALEEAQR